MDDRFVLINKDHILRIEIDNMNINKYKARYDFNETLF